MSRIIRLSLALLLTLPLFAACTIDPSGPDAPSGFACGSAAPADGSCSQNEPTPAPEDT
jgi:hypothetical protein